jgi:hypothetical protein
MVVSPDVELPAVLWAKLPPTRARDETATTAAIIISVLFISTS